MYIQAVGLPALPTCWEGAVHSVFQNSCNIQAADGPLITVHRFSFGMLPRSLFVPELDTWGLTPGDPVQADGEEVRLGRLRLSWAGRVETVSTAVPRLEKRPEHWPRAWQMLTQRQRQMEDTAVTRLLYHRLREALSNLWTALKQNEMEWIQSACGACVGLGQGLTPSGDDMLLGTMAALHMYAPELAPRLAQGIRPFLGRTNDISRSYLELVLDGYAATPVIRAAGSLVGGGTGAVELLLNVGHSSGCDILEGILTAVRQIGMREKGWN